MGREYCLDCQREGIYERMISRHGHYYCRRCGLVVVKHGAFQGFGKALREVTA